jgi:hypothetical protein
MGLQVTEASGRLIDGGPLPRLDPPQHCGRLSDRLEPAGTAAHVCPVRAAVDEGVQRLVRLPHRQVDQELMGAVPQHGRAMALAGAPPPDEAEAVLGDPVDGIQRHHELAITWASSGASGWVRLACAKCRTCRVPRTRRARPRRLPAPMQVARPAQPDSHQGRRCRRLAHPARSGVPQHRGTRSRSGSLPRHLGSWTGRARRSPPRTHSPAWEEPLGGERDRVGEC